MRGPDLAAKGRTSQDDFPVTESRVTQSHQVRQIGVAARKLFDGDRSAVVEVLQQKWLQPREIEFFACPYCSRLIANCRHTRSSSIRYRYVSNPSPADKCRARRIAAPIAPAEVKTTALAAGAVSRTTCASPRSTRKQNSCQDSMPGAIISPATHFAITASNSL